MVDIIPKKSVQEIPFANILPFIAGALLLTSVLGYVVLMRVEAEGLDSLAGLEEGILKVGTREDRTSEAKVFKAEKIIKDFTVLLASRRESSNFFDNFASLIHPQVWISEINLDISGLRAVASGQSANFKILEQQLIFFREQQDFIESFGLSELAIGEDGEAKFSIDFIFKPEIFN